tara:strand:- start:679 stop:1089 length:411 start_codon:yes stop_codon:yes gene_type:complete
MQKVITEPSICIPRTLNNVTRQEVKNVFEQLIGAGSIDRVDIVKNREQESQFCRIFIHFRYWPNSETATSIRNRLNEDEELKIVYNEPWFWKCVKSRVAKPDRNDRPHAPYVMSSNSSTPSKKWADTVDEEPSTEP